MEHTQISRQVLTSFARRWSIAAAWAYFTLLFGWFVLYLLTGDRYGYLGLVNSFAVYFFAPLPVAFLLAAVTRRRELWGGSALAAAVFIWLWGGLFAPPPARARASANTLLVMTYNVLGVQTDVQAALGAIRAEDADLVFLQEINTTHAAAISTELIGAYPYQILDPVDGVRGMGTISKFPIELNSEQLPLRWIGRPQAMTLDWNGQAVALVNFHTWPPGLGPAWAVTQNFRERERQAQALADFARAKSAQAPVILAGDVNATELSTTYRIITTDLTDSWRAGGYGFGHTFPGSRDRGSIRSRLFDLLIPNWLVRIDYIFHSDHWATQAAWNAAPDGASDHRAVVAELSLR